MTRFEVDSYAKLGAREVSGLPPDDRTTRETALSRTAAVFRAAGDLGRLRILLLLDRGEHCVTDLADATRTKLSTLSQQLRVLLLERVVIRRRVGKHNFYSLADERLRRLLRAATMNQVVLDRTTSRPAPRLRAPRSSRPLRSEVRGS